MPKRGKAAAAVLMALILCMIGPAALATMHTEVTSPALEMTAEVGYDGMITYGKAIPIRVRVANHGEDFEGRLGVNAYVNHKNYDRYETPVVLPAGAEREFMLTPSVYARQPVFTVEITRDGETVCAVNAEADRAANPNAMLIGVLSSRARNLNNLNIDHENDILNRYELWQTVPLTADTFPEEENLLNTFGVLVLDDIDPEMLTERQQALLKGWLDKGRILLCGGGAAGARSVAYFSETTGLRVSGFTASDSVVAGLQRSVGRTESGNGTTVNLAEIEGGEPVAADAEGRGLVWRTEAGTGRIYTTAFEAGDEKLNADPLMHWYWQQLLVTLDQGVYSSALYSGGRETANAVAYAAGVTPIAAKSRLLPGLLIAAGVPILASLGWLALKKADRRQWMWGLLPLLAAAAVISLALLSGGAETNRPMAVITENLVQSGNGMIRSYRGLNVAVPQYGRHSYATNGEKLQVSSYDYVELDEEEEAKNLEPTILRTCYVTGGENAVSAESVTAWEQVDMSCEAESSLQGRLEGSVWMEEDGLHGEIVNGTDHRLTGGLLLTPYGYASVPPMDPGAQAGVILAHSTVKDPVNPVLEDGCLYIGYMAGMYTTVYQACGGDDATEDTASLRTTMINNAVDQLRQETYGRNYYTIGEPAQFIFSAVPEGLPSPVLTVDGKPVEQTATMNMLTAELQYLEIGRSGIVFRPAGTDLPVRVETDENNMPAGEYKTSGTQVSYHSLTERPTFRFDLQNLRDVQLEKVQICMEEYYTRQARAYALNARTGEWDQVQSNEAIANPENYLDGEGKLYLQFRSDVQDQYMDVPTPMILIEGRVKQDAAD